MNGTPQDLPESEHGGTPAAQRATWNINLSPFPGQSDEAMTTAAIPTETSGTVPSKNAGQGPSR